MVTLRQLLLCALFLLLGSSAVWSAKWEMYKVIDTIPIKKVSKKKVFNEVEEWFKKERNTRLVRTNENQFTLEGKSFFVYYNHVQTEDVFLSPRANERTTGNVVYQIIVKIYDSIVVAECTNFTHEAYYSEFGSITFQTFTDYETVPPGRCLESKIWCNKVWIDLKSRSKAIADEQISRMVPESMVRKKGKVFKTDKNNNIDTTPVKIIDPKDYLNIENYLIKEEKKPKKEVTKTKKKKKKDEDEDAVILAPQADALPDSVADLVPEPTYESIKQKEQNIEPTSIETQPALPTTDESTQNTQQPEGDAKKE